MLVPSHETRTPCCHSKTPFLSISRKRISLMGMSPEGERIPCSVRKERSDPVRTAGKNDCRINAARDAGSVEGGSPSTGSPINRCASEKFETFATASTASFQSGKDREVEKASGAGCLYSQIVDTR